jgi:hypothetical protein
MFNDHLIWPLDNIITMSYTNSCKGSRLVIEPNQCGDINWFNVKNVLRYKITYLLMKTFSVREGFLAKSNIQENL